MPQHANAPSSFTDNYHVNPDIQWFISHSSHMWISDLPFPSGAKASIEACDGRNGASKYAGPRDQEDELMHYRKAKELRKFCAKTLLKFDANGSRAQRTPDCYDWRMTCGGRGISVLFDLVLTKCSEQCSPKPQDFLALERQMEIQFYRKLAVTSYSLVFRRSLRALSERN